MSPQQIHELFGRGVFPDSKAARELIETHISWVILTDHYAFKIKKPLKFSFLDFSTPERRAYFCKRELELNLRLAPEMYLKVTPVCYNSGYTVGERCGETIDTAVMMRRMDSSREMDLLLIKDQVKPSHIHEIARTIAKFHQGATQVTHAYDLSDFVEKFNDITSITPFVSEVLGSEYVQIIKDSIKVSDIFLKSNASFMEERFKDGFIRDGHGDLHSKNIFLYEEPVIFDCIEFSDALRQLDVLDEIAFFCMDLDANEKPGLSNTFFDYYMELMGMPCDQGAIQLFTYYKGYRANIRAKVLALNLAQITPQKIQTHEDTGDKKLFGSHAALSWEW